jgi:hypothetical protein
MVLRCYLHAAAVGNKTMRDILRWSTQPQSPEPVQLLRRAEYAGAEAKGWAAALEAAAQSEPMHRGSVWATLTQALNCFSDPGVLEAVSPGPDDAFDMAQFLAGRNTLYILGKERKSGSVAPVVSAMLEDMFDEIRKIASRMPGSRLDPPLTVELNEAAHIAPLPSLPAYMGDSGGFSIALHVYLQSLSQARSRWGVHEAMIMWDNAAIRVIMGGAGNVEDLEVVVARAARPVEVQLTPWWERKDGNEIGAGKARTEKKVLEYSEEADRNDPFRKYAREAADLAAAEAAGPAPAPQVGVALSATPPMTLLPGFAPGAGPDGAPGGGPGHGPGYGAGAVPGGPPVQPGPPPPAHTDQPGAAARADEQPG